MTAVFLQILNISITAGWLVLAVVVMRLLLKRAPKAVTVALWGLVALRLVLPFSIESPFSLVPDTTPITKEWLETTVTTSTKETITSATTVPNKAGVSSPTKPDVSASTTRRTSPTASKTQSTAPSVTQPAAGVVTTTASAPKPTEKYEFSWITTAAIVWCVGMVGMLLYAAISMARLHKQVKASIRLHDNVFTCDDIVSPFILGIVRPRIFLPSTLTDSEKENILSHEFAHLRRGDHIIKPFGFLLLTVYWFHPLVWVAYILLCRDVELACDERVLKSLDDDKKKEYLETLLLYCSRPEGTKVCPLAFGETGVKERIFSALSYKKPTLWIMLVSIVAVIAVAVCFLTVRPAAKSETPTPQKQAATVTAKPNGEMPSVPMDSMTLKINYEHIATPQESDSGTAIVKIDPKNKLLFADGSHADEYGTYVDWVGLDETNWYMYSATSGEVTQASRAEEKLVSLIWQAFNKNGTIDLNMAFTDEENALLEALQNMYIDADKLKENIATYMAKHASDVQWLEDNLGYQVTVDGNVQTMSFRANVYTLVELCNEMVGDAMKQSVFGDDAVLLTTVKKELEQTWWSLEIKSVSGMVSSVIFEDDTIDGTSTKITCEVVDIGATQVDLTEIKKRIEEENDGYIMCRECGSEPASLKGYCGLCYLDYVCLLCGNEGELSDDGYCEDCFVPCAVCRARHGEMEHDGEQMCYVCYYSRFCANDDGNPVYQSGYCEECYQPCSICLEQAEREVDGTWYCYTCYYLHYCYNDDGNPVYKDGYCQECYQVCTKCGKGGADEGYDGLCEACYFESVIPGYIQSVSG